MQFISVILLLVVSVAAERRPRSMHSRGSMLRPNYGVAFEKVGEIMTASRYWYHTFVMTLPDPAGFILETNQRDSIDAFKFRRQTFQLAKQTEQLLDFARKRLPELPVSRITRRKRSAGLIEKDLFGTATIDYVQKMANLPNADAMNSQDWRASLRDMQSYMKVDLKQKAQISELVQKEHKHIYQLENEFQILNYGQSRRQEWIERTISWMAQREFGLGKLLIIIADLHAAVDKLAQGILSDTLIADRDLEVTFRELRSIQASMGNDFYFLDTDPRSYQYVSDLKAFINGTDIWITLKLPVGDRKTMNLFKLHSWNTPVYNDSAHATQISDLPEFVVLDEFRFYLGTLSAFDLHQCTGKHKKLCPFSLAYQRVTGRNCIGALVRENRFSVQAKCDFMLKANVMRPLLVPIATGKVLVQASRQLHIHCGSETKTEDGCHSCLVDVPCNCFITNYDYEYMAPTAQKCRLDSDNNKIKKHYMVNLAILRQFEKNETRIVETISARSTFFRQMELSSKRFKELDVLFNSVPGGDVVIMKSLKQIEDRQTEMVMQTDTVQSSMLNSWDSGMLISTDVGRFSLVVLALVIINFGLIVYHALFYYRKKQKFYEDKMWNLKLEILTVRFLAEGNQSQLTRFKQSIESVDE